MNQLLVQGIIILLLLHILFWIYYNYIRPQSTKTFLIFFFFQFYFFLSLEKVDYYGNSP